MLEDELNVVGVAPCLNEYDRPCFSLFVFRSKGASRPLGSFYQKKSKSL